LPYALWSGLTPFYAGDVWLHLSLLVASNNSSYLTNSVGYKPFYPGSVSGTQGYFFIEKALSPFCFTTAQVAFSDFNPHNFAAPGNMETALCAFMSFDFWHPKFPLFLLVFSLSG
jgi:hypothetical protein